MKVLFIGGTGNISEEVSRQAIEAGMELYILNRGNRQASIPGAISLVCDIYDEEKASGLLSNYTFDCVVNWINFTPEDIERDLRLFSGKTGQYIFISSATVYQKPSLQGDGTLIIPPVITEKTPLENRYWDYARNKILCEKRLMKAFQEEGFPVTIVRPSMTYDTLFPVAMGGWGCYTLAARILSGKKIIVHGDGTSIWCLTHSEDFSRGFLGLIGHPQSIGESFHITSDELLTWNQIYGLIAEALGKKAEMIHIPSDFIAQLDSGSGASLLGDKAHSTIFDNSKIKKYVPGFHAKIPFAVGIKRTVAWFHSHESRKVVNEEENRMLDRIISAFEGKSTQV